MPVKTNFPLVIAVLHPNIGGWIGGYITKKNIKPWYESLKRPTWTPPNWVFAPVWTTLYCTMGYSSYLVWKDAGSYREAAIPLSIYGANLILNWSWSPLFFGLHNLKLALYEIAVLWGSTVAMGIAFYNVNPIAGYLVIPYLAWNSLAAALNYVIYRDNKPMIEDITDKKKE
ncbi:translocator protein [Colletes gigas]|uniref:translocator protein n=1 Tax=Colletes gigas TaxID=935657 RepID=UPI001C9B9D60|nr:translocator protein [Colletes gigas]XP_043254456.1 translocator protein [Colletes gigas]XP_043254458.1 translocator protein [Colletes gigas]XP_043254459.1 translocator protein [Colletes gigas]